MKKPSRRCSIGGPSSRRFATRSKANRRGEHEEGLEELQAIHDPAAIEALIAVFKNRPSSAVRSDPRDRPRCPGKKRPTHCCNRPCSRRTKTLSDGLQQLKNRSVYGYVPKLMAALSTPMETKFEVIRDSDGSPFPRNGAARRRRRHRGQDGRHRSRLARAESQPGQHHRPSLRGNVSRRPNDGQGDCQTQPQAERITTTRSIGCSKTRSAKWRPRDPEAWWDWWHNYNVMSSSTKAGLRRQLLQPGRGPLCPVHALRYSELHRRTNPDGTPVAFVTRRQLPARLAQ